MVEWGESLGWDSTGGSESGAVEEGVASRAGLLDGLAVPALLTAPWVSLGPGESVCSVRGTDDDNDESDDNNDEEEGGGCRSSDDEAGGNDEDTTVLGISVSMLYRLGLTVPKFIVM